MLKTAKILRWASHNSYFYLKKNGRLFSSHQTYFNRLHAFLFNKNNQIRSINRISKTITKSFTLGLKNEIYFE